MDELSVDDTDVKKGCVYTLDNMVTHNTLDGSPFYIMPTLNEPMTDFSMRNVNDFEGFAKIDSKSGRIDVMTKFIGDQTDCKYDFIVQARKFEHDNELLEVEIDLHPFFEKALLLLDSWHVVQKSSILLRLYTLLNELKICDSNTVLMTSDCQEYYDLTYGKKHIRKKNISGVVGLNGGVEDTDKLVIHFRPNDSSVSIYDPYTIHSIEEICEFHETCEICRNHYGNNGRVNFLFTDCQHSLCNECYRQCQNCPFCRSSNMDYIQIKPHMLTEKSKFTRVWYNCIPSVECEVLSKIRSENGTHYKMNGMSLIAPHEYYDIVRTGQSIFDDTQYFVLVTQPILKDVCEDVAQWTLMAFDGEDRDGMINWIQDWDNWDFQHIMNVFKHYNCKLTDLYLPDWHTTDLDVQVIADALKHGNCKLTHLGLAENNITDLGAQAIADALKHGNCKLTRLYLPENNMTDLGAQAIADALKHGNCKLTHLDLSKNNITDLGVHAIADALKHGSCKLTELYLSKNNITDLGAHAIADALKHGNCKLTHLGLWENNITDLGVHAIADALKHGNCKLTHLGLWENNMTDLGAQAIADALKHGNCKLTHLDLSKNNITDLGVHAIADALKHGNCKLTHLGLWENNMTDLGAQAIADALKHGNCKLTELSVSRRAQAIVDAVKHGDCAVQCFIFSNLGSRI